jgi:4'-phosphopantetheinyl transferase
MMGPRLQGGVVDVWCVSLSDDHTVAASVLSDDERVHCARLRLPALRRRYTIAHVRMREILGAYLDEDPRRIELRPGPFGKPHVRGVAELQFSLAHSGQVALVAVTAGSRVGVDVELARELADLDGLARSTMTGVERRALSAVRRPLRNADFHQRWAVKEAVAKALGLGLRLPFSRIAVALEGRRGARLIKLDVPGERTDAWTLRPLRPVPRYRAAVAVDGPGPVVRTRRWPP